jgi:putative spermidine/putrescine transport system permease protein
MTQSLTETALPPRATAAPGAPTSWAWLGVAPFVVFAVLFLILPTMHLVVGAFQDADGGFTFANVAQLFSDPQIVSSFLVTIEVSMISAVGGAIIGFLLAYAGVMGGLPGWVRPVLMTFSGVAPNFAGIPLAFAFLATLGRTGLVTALLFNIFDFKLYDTGFNITSFWGLALAYLYFQIPLMVLILVPALDGLKREWREASDILGGGAWEFWRYVAIPILWPSLVGTTLLLFANAFGAVATAYGLTGSGINLVTIMLFAQIRGDVLHNQNLGYAISLGMVVITVLSNLIYIVLRARTRRGMQ